MLGKLREVCDVISTSPTFFRVLRSESGLDSRDSRRIGLGLSPVGRCRLPFKEQGHCMRVEIDASNPGFGLILGWILIQHGLAAGSFLAGVRDSRGPPAV